MLYLSAVSPIVSELFNNFFLCSKMKFACSELQSISFSMDIIVSLPTPTSKTRKFPSLKDRNVNPASLSYKENLEAPRPASTVVPFLTNAEMNWSILPNNSSLFEWRTQHQLDSAFKDLSEDPQQINIKGSLVTILPDTYKGNRLGHNWSISWVADEFFNSLTSI